MTARSFDLAAAFAVLGPGGSAVPVGVTPTIYQDLDRRFGGFADHCLVSCHSFSADWSSWEMHPAGDEVVCLLSGRAKMVLEIAGKEEIVELRKPGSYVIVPRGTWHTGRAAQAVTMLFITPGAGTEHRPA